jgi:mono/diheme cytochrome c family protein
MEKMRQLWPRIVVSRVLKTVWIPICVAFTIACGHLDMYDQARYDPYEETDFFPDGAASRPLEEGVVARGQLLNNNPIKTGRDENNNYVTNPIAVDAKVIEHGKSRFNIYCVPCHGQYGAGNGITTGYFKAAGAAPVSFYDPRIVGSPDGYIFEVITNGKGAMYSYASRVFPEDRWAIVAYIRELQRNPPQGVLLPTPAPAQQAEGATAQPAEGATTAPEGATAAPATDATAPAGTTPTPGGTIPTAATGGASATTSATATP